MQNNMCAFILHRINAHQTWHKLYTFTCSWISFIKCSFPPAKNYVFFWQKQQKHVWISPTSGRTFNDPVKTRKYHKTSPGGSCVFRFKFCSQNVFREWFYNVMCKSQIRDFTRIKNSALNKKKQQKQGFDLLLRTNNWSYPCFCYCFFSFHSEAEKNRQIISLLFEILNPSYWYQSILGGVLTDVS